MTKKVAVINDLSGLGRCSLTAAISVLSAMGIQACPLPTAILSSQTEYPSYYCYDFTDKMDYFRQEWKKLGTSFPESIPVMFPVSARLNRSCTFWILSRQQTPFFWSIL